MLLPTHSRLHSIPTRPSSVLAARRSRSTHLHNDISPHDNLSDLTSIESHFLQLPLLHVQLFTLGYELNDSDVIGSQERGSLTSFELEVVGAEGIREVLNRALVRAGRDLNVEEYALSS
jgi:hypothetical protein